MYNKRRLSQFTQEDNEEEDEWEREASVSNVHRRQVQPNIYAVQTRILDDQYEILSETREELTTELKELQSALKELEAEEFDLTTNIDISKQEFVDSIEETLSLIYTTNDQLNNNNTTQSNGSVLLDHDASLLKELEATVGEWNTVVTDTNNDQTNEKKIKSLGHNFRYTEFEVLDLIAQITGLEARIQSLERDISKLNALPQMIPVLRSETERYQQEIRNATNLLGSLERDSMRPLLIKLSKLKIEQPLDADKASHKKELCEQVLKEMEKIYNIALRQSACQQLVLYSDNAHSASKGSTLKSYTKLLEEHVNELSEKDVEKQEDVDVTEFMHTKLIKNLLDEFFKSKKDITLFTVKTQEDMTLTDQVQALKDYESKLRKKWEGDFQACLDAGEILDGLKSRLTQSLYKHSNSTADLIMTPKPYSDLQSELEFRTNELKVSISGLEKKINNPNENLIFDRLKKLFSVFYTDPDAFPEEFARAKDELWNSLFR
ncbi:unnamed protein product [Mucor hiemalis]